MSRIGGWEATGFGDRLRELREAASLSQSQLAAKAGCAKSAVAKLEGGLHEPAWPLVLLLADALGVGVAEFRPPPGWTPPPKKKRGRPGPARKGSD